MFNRDVRSEVRPDLVTYYVLNKKTGLAGVYMRENIHEVEEEGEAAGFEYDEVYFETTEDKGTIEKNEEVWREYGAAWEREENLTETQIIEKLQAQLGQARADIDFIAAMTDIEL